MRDFYGGPIPLVDFYGAPYTKLDFYGAPYTKLDFYGATIPARTFTVPLYQWGIFMIPPVRMGGLS
ncbi:MAG: hypothetical protein C4519_23285 [Desulfobacteraceae bacterium]|nr:MAG: hypothetical protein C4519_23285 [Desulfobacteraceae bacterium]